MTTTPTGILIDRCDTCGLTHPVSRKHCPVCNSPSFFCHQPREGA
jgi:uncharacterized OB-fold protein